MSHYAIALSFLFVVAGCASNPATEAQRQQVERRLLLPFAVAREVGCGELRLDITGNFNGVVGRPAVDPARHRVETRRGEGFVDTVWTNQTGMVESAFVVTIGEPPQVGETGWQRGPQTQFRVVQQVVLRIHEDRRPLQLDAVATGPLVLVKDSAAPPRQLQQFAILDGAVRP